MADWVMKQNDTWPPLGDAVTPVVLKDDTDTPINLTGATVKLFIRKADGTGSPLSRTVTIVTAANGTVRYEWDPADTADVGDFVMEYQITFGDGKIATVPTEGYLTLSIIDDIAQ
jgi:hypothetical protein